MQPPNPIATHYNIFSQSKVATTSSRKKRWLMCSLLSLAACGGSNPDHQDSNNSYSQSSSFSEQSKPVTPPPPDGSGDSTSSPPPPPGGNGDSTAPTPPLPTPPLTYNNIDNPTPTGSTPTPETLINASSLMNKTSNSSDLNETHINHGKADPIEANVCDRVAAGKGQAELIQYRDCIEDQLRRRKISIYSQYFGAEARDEYSPLQYYVTSIFKDKTDYLALIKNNHDTSLRAQQNQYATAFLRTVSIDEKCQIAKDARQLRKQMDDAQQKNTPWYLRSYTTLRPSKSQACDSQEKAQKMLCNAFKMQNVGDLYLSENARNLCAPYHTDQHEDTSSGSQ